MSLGVRALCGLAAAAVLSGQATAQGGPPVEAARGLVAASEWNALAVEAGRWPLFREELERTRAEVDRALEAGVLVPAPKDPGGGYTHEQHKRNYRAIHGAGALYGLTGEARYADYVRRMLLAYAEIYPGLGPHPAAAGQEPGRLFWQSLNDSVWLVYAIQGYDAVRGTLSAQDRRTIEGRVFRPMAAFHSAGSPRVFDRIHNHATWANAGVGMTGYVLGDRDLVDKALLGLDKSGRAGFLRQLDLLFSPDGYYAEGPYYQRYALLPFVVFARAVEHNEPERRIFAHRGGLLLKAVRAAIQQTYGGNFFPLNDALPDKSLKTEELYHAVAVAYGATADPALLSIAGWQGRTVLSPDGLAVARDLAAGKAQPFPFRSMLLRDGPDGDQGGLAILRSGPGDDAQALVAKNTAQGMGHGHFDKLNWILYDEGQAVVTDYGAARFLNVEAKEGGRYLPENTSWAKQTIAHNTLVVNETSQFGGKLARAEQKAPRQLHFSGEGDTRVSTAEMAGAYEGVVFRRTLAQLSVDGLEGPVVVDLLRVRGSAPARYDLPLHYAGSLIEIGFPLNSHPVERPVLGAGHGYQHLWVDAEGAPEAANAAVTWLLNGRFYTYRFLPQPGARAILAESGANDPRFNLRREPVLIQRVDGAADVTFVGVLEPHGRHDGAAETTVGSRSRIGALRHVRGEGAEAVVIEMLGGATTILALADDPAADLQHRLVVDGRTLRWRGHFGRFDASTQKVGTGRQ
ncbi:MAG: alginate lyase family protein [Phenylobacterium sp.]|uniref:alginate lyase family protein n=1 Tax=Phenylobacterium sp. TaxID=1871053 RepID=UPI002735D3B2|nr:alginate lyase family protein [Phenylobacterium sp.]MDP3746471.1 alginate lyase family protein [Phenylobacterium sp.]